MMNAVFAVGSGNKAKVATVRAIVDRIWGPNTPVHAYAVASDVAAQPLSAESTIQGAQNRAQKALAALKAEYPSTSDLCFGVGIEGGIEKIGDQYFESTWVVVVDSTGKVGTGSSARFEMSPVLMKPILEEGKELAEVIDAMTGLTDVRSDMGAMGILTGGRLCRQEAGEHGFMFALAPWLSSDKFWKFA
jgi:inosine/xanthosine triphosphatase